MVSGVCFGVMVWFGRVRAVVLWVSDRVGC